MTAVTGYVGHVMRDIAAGPGESVRRRCACGLLRRVRPTASGYVTETSDDGETWRAATFNEHCSARSR